MKAGKVLRLTDEEFKDLLVDRPDAVILHEINRGFNKEVLDPHVKRGNKLGAKKVEYDGYIFDSQLEWKRYKVLRVWESAGIIQNLDCEHKRVGKRDKEAIKRHRWVLLPAYMKGGKRVRAVTYTDDFQYEIDGQLIVEDIKGFATASFLRSAKMFGYSYPSVNFFVNYSVTGWYEINGGKNNGNNLD